MTLLQAAKNLRHNLASLEAEQPQLVKEVSSLLDSGVTILSSGSFKASFALPGLILTLKDISKDSPLMCCVNKLRQFLIQNPADVQMAKVVENALKELIPAYEAEYKAIAANNSGLNTLVIKALYPNEDKYTQVLNNFKSYLASLTNKLAQLERQSKEVTQELAERDSLALATIFEEELDQGEISSESDLSSKLSLSNPSFSVAGLHDEQLDEEKEDCEASESLTLCALVQPILPEINLVNKPSAINEEQDVYELIKKWLVSLWAELKLAKFFDSFSPQVREEDSSFEEESKADDEEGLVALKNELSFTNLIEVRDEFKEKLFIEEIKRLERHFHTITIAQNPRSCL